MSEMITGRNAVLEALKSGRQIEKIAVAKGAEGSVKKICAMARDAGVSVQYMERRDIGRIAGADNHQGVFAVVSDYRYFTADDMIEKAAARGEDPFIIILDGIEDPHNLGAITRSADCAGAHGVMIPKRRSAEVNETVAKTSAGASEYMMCARVTNLKREIDELKAKGLWICACDMGGEALYGRDLTGPIALVVGGEGRGISRLIRESCDFVVSIPMSGHVNSLNASNAAAVLMYEIVRQRGGAWTEK